MASEDTRSRHLQTHLLVSCGMPPSILNTTVDRAAKATFGPLGRDAEGPLVPLLS